MLSANKPSLYREFLILIIATTILVGVITLILIWRVITSESDAVKAKLEHETVSLEQSLGYSLDYTSFTLVELAKQIRHKKQWQNPVAVDRLLSSFRLSHENGIMIAWDMLAWVDDTGKVVIGGKSEMLQHVSDPTAPYPLLQSKNEPNKMHLGKAFLGPLSQEKVLPVAIGVTDETGRYVGSILLGFSLGGVLLKLSNIVADPAIAFMLTDRQGDPLLASSPKALTLINAQLPKIQFKMKEGMPHFSLSDGIFKTRHYQYSDLKRYPYRIITAYDPEQSRAQLIQALYPKLIELFLLSLLAIGILLVIQQRIIQPIAKLSKAALLVSQGEPTVQIPINHFQHEEINMLAYHIMSMATMMQELKQMQQELAVKTHAAKSSDRAKSEFLACVSHELRTPLNAIIGYAEMIHAQVVGPITNQQYVEYAAIIHSSGLHLLKTISDILDIANAESGMMQIKMRSTDLPKLLKEAIDSLEQIVQEKRLRLTVSLPDDLPPVQADPLRLKQAIRNLLSNAIKFSDPDDHIDIYAYFYPGGAFGDGIYAGAHDVVRLHINDTGIGIAEEDMERVMDPFGQADSGINRNYEGIGLGLPIAKKLLSLQNGTLEISSTPNHGTQVVITLQTV